MDDIDLTSLKYKPWKDSTRMPFGKYKGRILENVPASYLLWWYDAQKEIKQFHGLALYIEKKYEQLKEEVDDERRDEEWCDASDYESY